MKKLYTNKILESTNGCSLQSPKRKLIPKAKKIVKLMLNPRESAIIFEILLLILRMIKNKRPGINMI